MQVPADAEAPAQASRGLIEPAPTAKSGAMAVQRLTTWFAENRDGLLIGGAVALGLVVFMLILRSLGRQAVSRDPEGMGWRTVI